MNTIIFDLEFHSENLNHTYICAYVTFPFIYLMSC